MVEWTSTLLTTGNGTNLGWVGTLADVTAEAAATAAMQAARDTALAATRMQRDFAASASHELKTPTASVVGFVEEVLDNNELSDVDRKHLDIAYRSAQRLSRLIDDLLVLGEADVAASDTHFEPTEVMQLIQLAVSPFTGTALHSNVDLSIGPTRSLYALADPLRLEQALTNLISNALKFTPPGGAIRITAHREQDTVQIDVSDTGVGIKHAALDAIFNRFYRTPDAINAGVTGSGLGLAIARAMIETQHGQLTVTSALGQGSTFTITLPAAPHRPPA
jgi:signal transduction histidine kinase